MSSSTLKRKRQRQNEDSESIEDGTLVIKSKYWFDDGNVVLQAENTQFRVHRSMLAHHSNVFKDMLSMPQPLDRVEPDASIEGCPIVILADKALDVEYMISMIYDNFKNNDIRGPMAFDRLAAILRLGKKYDIDYFCTEGLRRIRTEFPTTYADWTLRIRKDRAGEIVECENYLEKVIDLAHELSIESVLPSVYLLYAIRNTSVEIFNAFVSEDGKALPPDVVKACLHGRDRLHILAHEITMEIWSTELLSEKCTTPKRCWSGCNKYLAQSTFFPAKNCLSHLMMNQDFPTAFTNYLCDKCKLSLATEFKDRGSHTWDKLPKLFSFQTWDKMKDFDT